MRGVERAVSAVLVGAILGFSPVLPVVSTSAEEAAETAKYRINIAGRQRMLTQRMAKAMCFFENDILADAQFDKMKEAHDLFDATLDTLYNGGGERNLEPETSRRIREKLEKVMADWDVMGPAIEEELDSHQINPEASRVVHETNLVILADMNDAVSLIEQAYANPNEVALANAFAINLFGRQRMLSQKAAKEYCYIMTGYEVDHYREELKTTRDLFDNTLKAITEGMPALGVAPPPTQEIKDQLHVVEEIWRPFYVDLTHAIEGGEVPIEELHYIVTESDHILVEMNKAVSMYEAH